VLGPKEPDQFGGGEDFTHGNRVQPQGPGRRPLISAGKKAEALRDAANIPPVPESAVEIVTYYERERRSL
jgi:hypothetical protein